MTTNDYMLSFRDFLTSPEAADRDITIEHLTEVNELLGNRIHYHHVPPIDPEKCDPDNLPPYLWYGQSDTQGELSLNCSSQYPDTIGINVEIYSIDPGLLQTIKTHVTHALSDYGNPRTGSPFGDLVVQDVIVGSQDDDYIPVGINLNVDVAWHIETFNVQVYPLWCLCSEQDPSFGY